MRSFVTSKNVKWCHLIWPTLYNYCSLLYGCYIIIDTAQKFCLFIITVLKTFSIGFSFIHDTFSVINNAKRIRTASGNSKCQY